MSASKKTADVVTDVAADAAAEIAQQAEQMEAFIRSMNKLKVQFGLLGAAIGTAGGALTAYVIAYRKAEAKYSKIFDEEIEEVREHYRAKGRALEAEATKGDLEKIVKEKGYSFPENENDTPPPMAVRPPLSVVEEDDEVVPPPVSMVEAKLETRNVFEDAEITHEWNYHEERRRRSPDIPYVIHYDERDEFEGYQGITLTYYDGDDVLCNERDEIIDHADRDRLIGERNLERFGHGSNDVSVVYVRNDTLEIVYEIVRSPNSYAEEVHGIRHDAYDRGKLRRMRMRERDAADD